MVIVIIIFIASSSLGHWGAGRKDYHTLYHQSPKHALKTVSPVTSPLLHLPVCDMLLPFSDLGWTLLASSFPRLSPQALPRGRSLSSCGSGPVPGSCDSMPGVSWPLVSSAASCFLMGQDSVSSASLCFIIPPPLCIVSLWREFLYRPQGFFSKSTFILDLQACGVPLGCSHSFQSPGRASPSPLKSPPL